jgi:hypothetical protein
MADLSPSAPPLWRGSMREVSMRDCICAIPSKPPQEHHINCPVRLVHLGRVAERAAIVYWLRGIGKRLSEKAFDRIADRVEQCQHL